MARKNGLSRERRSFCNGPLGICGPIEAHESGQMYSGANRGRNCGGNCVIRPPVQLETAKAEERKAVSSDGTDTIRLECPIASKFTGSLPLIE